MVYPPPVPIPPSRPGRTAALVIGIVVGAVVVIGGLGVALFFVAQSAITSLESAELEFLDPDSGPPPVVDQLPLLEGEPSPPVAVEPLVCDEACFTLTMLNDVVPPDEAFEKLGLPVEDYTWGDYSRSIPGREYTAVHKAWLEADAEPDECFFTYFSSPVAAADPDDRPRSSTDTINYLGYHYSDDNFSGIELIARVFPDSGTAEEHMRAMDAIVPSCTSLQSGGGTSYWAADVTTIPALNLPPSVAATGWIEDSPYGRYYVVDLQRGNLVSRATAYADDALTEEQYRTFIEEHAVQLSQLTPVK
jgi:hypothetical protein